MSKTYRMVRIVTDDPNTPENQAYAAKLRAENIPFVFERYSSRPPRHLKPAIAITEEQYGAADSMWGAPIADLLPLYRGSDV